jgi:hypothetical protein
MRNAWLEGRGCKSLAWSFAVNTRLRTGWLSLGLLLLVGAIFGIIGGLKAEGLSVQKSAKATTKVPVLEEPLEATQATSEIETQELDAALDRFGHRRVRDDFSAIAEFQDTVKPGVLGLFYRVRLN